MVDVSGLDQTMVAKNGAQILEVLMKDEAIKAAESLDEAYDAFKKYADITKDQFNQFLNFSEGMFPAKTGLAPVELTEDELEGVVGGSIFGWCKQACNKIKDYAVDTWNSSPNWVKGAVICAAIGVAVATVAAGGMGVALGIGTYMNTGIIAEGVATFVSFLPAAAEGIAGAGIAAGVVGALVNDK